MRFSNRYTLKPKEGKKRIIRKFLIIPRTFMSPKTRWLEYANIIEEITCVVDYQKNKITRSYKWTEVGFVDEMVDIQTLNTQRRSNIDFYNDNEDDSFFDIDQLNRILNATTGKPLKNRRCSLDCEILSQDEVDDILNMVEH